ncbi:MAG: aminomethyl transferase family protein [Candidatus Limnocylindrales bacterium]
MTESLQQALDRTGDAVDLLRNARVAPVPFHGAPEHSNWMTEQRAWRESVALLDQSHHMNDLFIAGPDAMRLIQDFGVNRVDDYAVGKAKHLVTVNRDGLFIGDNILFHLEKDSFDLVGQPFSVNWIEYQAATGGYDVEVRRDPPTPYRGGRSPELYRYELQGPNALALVERLTGEAVPPVKFFTMTRLTIAGKPVRALRHGMAGQPGLELFGPWADGQAILDAILEIGDEFGLHQVGTKAYSTANLESGWMPALVPAIYDGDELTAFRDWLPASAAGSIGGSFAAADIRDYYVSPYDLGYGRVIAFDHDFYGRDGLAARSTGPSRQKVTLVWDEADLQRAIGGSLRAEGPPAKYLELPKARYATHQYDRILAGDDLVGISSDCGFIANERCFVSLALIDADWAEPGTEVVVVWGEEPNSAKPGVEPHEQVEIRARVAPAPLPTFARTTYRSA